MRFLSASEAAERLGLKSRQQVYNLIRLGVIQVYDPIPTYKGDRVLTYRIPEPEVDRVRAIRVERGLQTP